MGGLLTDSSDKVSSMRVMMVATVLTGCIVAILGIVLGRSGIETAALVGALLLPAFGGKALQSRGGA